MTAEVITVVLPEKLDSTTSAEVEATVMAALRPGVGVVIDGAQVDYMSAAGVRVLVDAFRKATEQGARLALCRLAGPAAECLLVSGFAALLPIAATVDEAAQKMRAELGTAPAARLHPRRNES